MKGYEVIKEISDKVNERIEIKHKSIYQFVFVLVVIKTWIMLCMFYLFPGIATFGRNW